MSINQQRDKVKHSILQSKTYGLLSWLAHTSGKAANGATYDSWRKRLKKSFVFC
jgi:hypothetical protein